MSKVRINDLARELEVKSRPILDALEAIGVTGKTHSSSIEADQAERVRDYFKNGGKSSTATRQSADNKPKFDLSKVSKPGDALKAILERKQAEAAAKMAPPARPAVTVAPPSNRPPVAAQPAAPLAATVVPPRPAAPVTATPPAAPAPRRIVPIPRPAAPNYVVPPAIASRPVTGPVVARPPAGITPTAVVAVPPAEPAVVKAAAVASPAPV